MKLIRAFFRAILMFSFLIGHILYAVITAFFKGPDIDRAIRMSHRWLDWVLWAQGLRMEKHGAPPKGAHIFVGNHRSYLDGIIAMSEIHSRTVAKSEVEKWPLIGYGAKLTGVIFVKRESKLSRSATLEAMRQALVDGYAVIVYPEGTTHLNPTTIDFRTGAFNLAAKHGFSIVPMAIEYEDPNDAWVGDETFASHYLRFFGRRRTHVHLRYGHPIKSNDINYLLTETKKWIDENMLLIRQEYDAKKTRQPVSSLAK